MLGFTNLHYSDLYKRLIYSKGGVYNYTQLGYSCYMDAIFKEMPVFDKYREDYLSDDEYRKLQEKLLEHPTAGAVVNRR